MVKCRVLRRWCWKRQLISVFSCSGTRLTARVANNLRLFNTAHSSLSRSRRKCKRVEAVRCSWSRSNAGSIKATRDERVTTGGTKCSGVVAASSAIELDHWEKNFVFLFSMSVCDRQKNMSQHTLFFGTEQVTLEREVSSAWLSAKLTSEDTRECVTVAVEHRASCSSLLVSAALQLCGTRSHGDQPVHVSRCTEMKHGLG